MVTNKIFVEGFNNNDVLTYEEKLLTVIFSCKYMPSALDGETFEDMLEYVNE